jgi:hypothetical protein
MILGEGRGEMSGENNYDLLVNKWKELKTLSFPESPQEPFLFNLYLALSEYEVYVSKIGSSFLKKGNLLDKNSIQIDEEWNEKLDSFIADENCADQVSALKNHKQHLDEFLRLVLYAGSIEINLNNKS